MPSDFINSRLPIKNIGWNRLWIGCLKNFEKSNPLFTHGCYLHYLKYRITCLAFYLHTVTSHLDKLNYQLLDTFIYIIVIQSYAAKRYLGLWRSMDKDKIKAIGKISRSFLEVEVCLTSGSKGPNKINQWKSPTEKRFTDSRNEPGLLKQVLPFFKFPNKIYQNPVQERFL